MRAAVERSIVDLVVAASRARGTLRFAGGLPWFAGHFPGQPLVPGVVLIEVARVLAERCTGCPLAIAVVQDARFLRPIPPEVPVTFDVRAVVAEAGWSCDAELAIDGAPAARVRLQLAALP